MGDSGLLHELGDPLRLGEVTRQRFLASDARERSLAAYHRIGDLLHVPDARVVPTAQPQGVDRRVRHHLGDRAVHVGLAEVEVARQGRHLIGALPGRAPHPQHIRIAYRLERLEVEARVEAAPDEPDA